MNWEAVGTVAEVVGAIGVIVSLIYVATEIRQNTAQVEEGIRVQYLAQLDASFQNFSRLRLLVAGDHEAARIWEQGIQDPLALDTVELSRFEALLNEYLFASQLVFMRVQEGQMYEEIWHNMLFSLVPLVERPGIAAYWVRWRGGFSADFVSAVEQASAAGLDAPDGTSDTAR